MNQDILKSFFIKFAVVAGVGAGGWMLLVGSRLGMEQEIRLSHASHVEHITNGERAIAEHAQAMNVSLERMNAVGHELQEQLGGDQSTNVHKQLQDTAENLGLTVSRIEPLQTSVQKYSRGEGQAGLELETKSFRVECAGTYSGIVKYIDELGNGPNIAKVGSFRILPTSSEHARVVLQISTYELVGFPEAIEELAVAQAQEGDQNED